MKKILLFGLSLICVVGLYAQDSYSTDFEEFAVGAYPSATDANWSTWSGALGGAEDVSITNAQAASGSNSIYFEGDNGGGPQDVLFLMGGKRTSGQLNFSAKFFLEAGNGGYFNMQGEEMAGVTWTYNVYFRTTGNLDVDTEAPYAYPVGEWFELGLNANLDEGYYEVSVDGVCVGSFIRENSSIASVDFFPLDGTNNFYVDDVAYDYSPTATPVPSPSLDAAISLTTGPAGFVGLPRNFDVTIENTGSEMLTSATIDYNINGTTYSQDATGLSIAPGNSSSVILTQGMEIQDGVNNITASLATVNGGSDDFACNDNASVNITGITPAPDRKVWAEEATGTWCQWCPRGDVFMNLMAERYPDHFVGTAVHNGTNDPMVVPEWDAGMGPILTANMGGYPGVVFERDIFIDPSNIEASVINYIQSAPTAYIVHEADFSDDTRELNIKVHTNFPNGGTGDFRLVVGLTEDNVTGTTSGYAQVNAYAGGGNGPMGNYHTLPNPVPASMMVYNHTSRALLTPFTGISQAYSTSVIVEPGWYEHDFTYNVPVEFDITNMHIVSTVLRSGGVVDNAQSSTIEASVDTKDLSLEQNIQVMPNPASDVANLRMQLNETAEVSIMVMDAMGKLMTSRNYGSMTGDQVYPILTGDYPEGVYYIRINANDRFATKKLVVTH